MRYEVTYMTEMTMPETWHNSIVEFDRLDARSVGEVLNAELGRPRIIDGCRYYPCYVGGVRTVIDGQLQYTRLRACSI